MAFKSGEDGGEFILEVDVDDGADDLQNERGGGERGGVRWGNGMEECVLWMEWPVAGVRMYCGAMYAMHDWVGMMG